MELMIFLPSGGRPSASTGFLTSSTTRRAGPATTKLPALQYRTHGEDQYQIALALAGLLRQNCDHGRAERSHRRRQQSDKGERQYLYQGISARPFKRVT